MWCSTPCGRRWLTIQQRTGRGLAEDWRWSNYRYAMGNLTSPPWLATDELLALFGTQKTAARRQYARFVAEGVGMESIWSDLKHQVFLGNEAFVDRQRELLEGQSLVEVSRQPLRKSIASLEVFMRGIYERYLWLSTTTGMKASIRRGARAVTP